MSDLLEVVAAIRHNNQISKQEVAECRRMVVQHINELKKDYAKAGPRTSISILADIGDWEEFLEEIEQARHRASKRHARKIRGTFRGRPIAA